MNISQAAANARENARRSDGKFGSYSLDEAAGVSLDSTTATFVSATANIHHTAKVADDATIGPYAQIGPGAVVSRGAYIASMASVGEGAFVGRGSWIGPSSTVGRGARIENECMIQDRAEVGDFATLETSAEVGHGGKVGANTHLYEGARVGRNCSVGVGCTIYEDVQVFDESAVGDDCIIGEYSTVARTSIGTDARIAPHAHISYSDLGERVEINPDPLGDKFVTVEDCEIADGVELTTAHAREVSIGQDSYVDCPKIESTNIGTDCTVIADDGVVRSSTIKDGARVELQGCYGPIVAGGNSSATGVVVESADPVYIADDEKHGGTR